MRSSTRRSLSRGRRDRDRDRESRDGAGDDDEPPLDVQGAVPVGGRAGEGVAGGVEEIQQQIRDRMKTIFKTRILTGCPINVPFSDVDDVMQKVEKY